MKSKTTRIVWIFFVGFIGFAIVLSCSYRFTGTKAELAGVSKEFINDYRVFVPIADNVTNFQGLESELSSSLVREITTLSNVTVVNQESSANLILVPKIVEVRKVLGLGTLQGNAETDSSGGLAIGAVTAREFRVVVQVELKLLELGSAGNWKKVWTKALSTEGTYDSSLRLIPSKGSSSSSVINKSRERLLNKALADNIAQMLKEQVFQGF